MTPTEIAKAWPATTAMLMDKRISVARVKRGAKWYGHGTDERRFDYFMFGMGCIERAGNPC